MPVAQTSFKVRGRGPFPIDMLRYDSAWPDQATDAAAIADSFERRPYVQGQRTEPWEITLLSADRTAPTIGRWDSFNVKVL
jgi:hypothetical protein